LLLVSYPRLFAILFIAVPFVLLGAEGCDPVPGSVPWAPPGETEGDDDDGETADDDDDDDEEPADPVDPPTEPPPEPPVETEPPPGLAIGVSITGVSVYQAVEVPLMVAVEGRAGPEADEPEEAPTPVIAGRDALVRVFVTLEAGYVMQSVRAEFLVDDGTGPQVLRATLVPRVDSTPDDLQSTFNVTLPGDVITPRTTLSVQLLQDGPVAGDEPIGGSTEGATWPGQDAPVSVGAIENGGELTVRIVPMAYSPDGSDRMPDVSDGQLNLLHSWLHRLYPATVVTLIVDEPMIVDAPILSGGDGWSDALYQLTDLREDRGIPSDEYIYGMVAPAESYSTFCRGGCVSGLGWRAADPTTAFTRASLGLGYTGVPAADTFVHEIGHNHGRMHAPCGGPASPDPEYPHGDGRLGVWGYDLVEEALVSPTEFADMMGYCRPRWISDYTWSALSDRIAWVNAAADMVPAPGWPKSLRVMDVSADGLARLRGTLKVDRAPDGVTQKLEVLNTRGVVVDTVSGYEQKFEDTGSRAILFVPPTHPSAFAVRLPGGAPLTL
jgi:hypothetical protein